MSVSKCAQQNWPEVELGEVCEFAYGKSLPAKSRSGSGYPVYGSNGPVGHHDFALTDGETIVIGRKGSFGEVHYSTEPCSPIDTTYYITEKQTDAYLPWLARRLRCLGLDQLNRAAAIPGLNRTDAYRQKLFLPPLAEQKRIAAILDAADALRAKRRESLAQLDSLLQSTFLDMFGDPVTNPKGWEQQQLDKLGQVQTGSTPPSKSEDMFDGEIPFITPGDLLETWVDSVRSVTEAGAEKSRIVNKGSTLVCCIGATIGKMGKASRLSAFNQQINSVSWGAKVDDNFGFEMMRFFKSKIANDGASTTLPILKKSLFQKIEVPIPPLDLQRRFATIVDSIEQQKTRLREHLAELDTLFASLQQRAFNGEL